MSGNELRIPPLTRATARIIGGRFHVVDELGRGGTGVVHRCVDLELGRFAAVKVFSLFEGDGAELDEARRRFVDEARLLASSRHPQIVEILDSGLTPEGAPYIATELLSGPVLSGREPMGWRDVVEIGVQGLARRSPRLRGLGRAIGVIFCVTLLIATITGGNMFQAWNVAIVTEDGLGIPGPLVGAIQAVLVGLVVLGGIKRIGAVAGRIVPAMCAIYLIAAFYVLAVNFAEIPAVFRLIFAAAFNPAEAGGAFVGATVGFAFLWGMKRALFSSEAGQGSSPIAHSAAKTHEPVREGVVAGLEPFIDTIVVSTLTSLVILTSGAWNRDGEATFAAPPAIIEAAPAPSGAPRWAPQPTQVPPKLPEAEAISGPWKAGDSVFVVARFSDKEKATGTDRRRITGTLTAAPDGAAGWAIQWHPIDAPVAPVAVSADLYRDYVGAALTSHAFDRVYPGLGKWLVIFASWLFALSTMISWSYYGEQGVIYIMGARWIVPYKVFYCAAIVVACLGIVTTETELDNLTSLGTGVMLIVNIPIMLIFGGAAMKAYRDYIRRLHAGEFERGRARPLTELVASDED